jgi:hypothetical protein
MDNVEISRVMAIDCLTPLFYGNGSVRTKSNREFSIINEFAILRGLNDAIVVPKATTTRDAVELLWCPCQFCVQLVWLVARTNRGRSSIRVIDVGKNFFIRNTLKF